ncbi:hypothetical protein [Thermogutta sp.]|uniref:hypothetical protein n=1 Tax=Thermogutta sp. TaxID=1962930 RepID=UPI0032201243
MDSLKCVLFGLTPRGGPKNHVFIFPAGLQKEASALAQRRSGEVERLLSERPEHEWRGGVIEGDLAVVADVVVQPSTGRPGKEWLCLISPGLDRASDGEKDNILKWLRQKFVDMQHLVQNYEWNTIRGESIALPDLKKWQGEAQKFFPGDVVLEFASAKDTSRRRVCGRVLMLAVGFGVAVLLAFQFGPGRHVWHPWAPGPLVEPQPRFQKLIQTLGLPQAAEPKDIAEKLSPVLVTERQDDRSPEDRIREVLQLIDEKVNKSPAGVRNSSVDELAGYPSILSPLGDLFPASNGHNFDPLGLIRSGDKKLRDLARWAEGTDYQQLNQFLRALSNLQDIPSDEKTQVTNDLRLYPPQGFRQSDMERLSDLFQLVDNPKLRSLCQDDSRRRFFVREDLEGLSLAQQATALLADLCQLGETKSFREFQASWLRASNGPIRNLVQVAKDLATRASHPKLGEAWSRLGNFFQEITSVCNNQAQGKTFQSGILLRSTKVFPVEK